MLSLNIQVSLWLRCYCEKGSRSWWKSMQDCLIRLTEWFHHVTTPTEFVWETSSWNDLFSLQGTVLWCMQRKITVEGDGCWISWYDLQEEVQTCLVSCGCWSLKDFFDEIVLIVCGWSQCWPDDPLSRQGLKRNEQQAWADNTNPRKSQDLCLLSFSGIFL